jgi:hypothetical protein
MRNEDDIEVHIRQLEERIAARRARLQVDVEAVGSATRSLIVSPGVLSAAAGFGFFLARATSRKRVAPRSAKAGGLLGLASGVGMTLLKLRFGDPSQWIGRFLSGRAAAQARTGTPSR